MKRILLIDNFGRLRNNIIKTWIEGVLVGLIYKIENHMNNKVYIGQTLNSIQRRYNGTSIETIYKNMHNEHLRRAMRKYGLDNFSIEILVETSDIDELNTYEVYYIDIFNSMDPSYGYNKRGGGKNNKASAELKQKFSVIQAEIKGVKVICVNTNEVFSTITKAAKKYKVNVEAIRTACKDHIKGATSGGVQWDYYIEGKTYELYNKNFYNAQPVICINTKEVYSSIKEAERKTGLNGIWACCHGECHTIGGRQWSFYKEGEEYELKKIIYWKSKAVICIETQKVYDSITEAEELAGAPNISLVISGERETSGGLHWDYYYEDKEYKLEDYIKEHVNASQREVICLTTGVIYKSIKEAQAILDINNVSMACRGLIKHSGGMEWAYWVEGKPYRPKEFVSKRKIIINNKKFRPIRLPKKIICIDTQEVFVRMKDAAKKYNITIGAIHNCCIGKSKTCMDMQWSFYEEGKIYNNTKIVRKDAGKPKKQVLCVELNKIYISISEADKELGISFKNISACCRGKRAKAGGYTWRFL